MILSKATRFALPHGLIVQPIQAKLDFWQTRTSEMKFLSLTQIVLQPPPEEHLSGAASVFVRRPDDRRVRKKLRGRDN